MNIFDAMSDRTVNIFELTFVLALRNLTFQNRLLAEGIMTDDEIRRFIADFKNFAPVHVTRRHLNKIVASIEEYDKSAATVDIVNAVQARIDFIGHILEGKQ